jgi:hypothetical protein
MRHASLLLIPLLALAPAGSATANSYGSVEPIANPAVLDTRLLRDQSLEVREAFATRLLECGIVDRVIRALSSSGAITTINGLNTHFEVEGSWERPTPPTSIR